MAERLTEGEIKAKKKIAATMKQSGIDIQSICTCTGLTAEKIEII